MGGGGWHASDIGLTEVFSSAELTESSLKDYVLATRCILQSRAPSHATV